MGSRWSSDDERRLVEFGGRNGVACHAVGRLRAQKVRCELQRVLARGINVDTCGYHAASRFEPPATSTRGGDRGRGRGRGRGLPHLPSWPIARRLCARRRWRRAPRAWLKSSAPDHCSSRPPRRARRRSPTANPPRRRHGAPPTVSSASGRSPYRVRCAMHSASSR